MFEKDVRSVVSGNYTLVKYIYTYVYMNYIKLNWTNKTNVYYNIVYKFSDGDTMVGHEKSPHFVYNLVLMACRGPTENTLDTFLTFWTGYPFFSDAVLQPLLLLLYSGGWLARGSAIVCFNALICSSTLPVMAAINRVVYNISLWTFMVHN